MQPWDWSPYLTDGGMRPDAISGLDPQFVSSLQSMFGAAPPNIQSSLKIGSGYRSNERQAELWKAALEKYGSPEAARKWVAPPGNSLHNSGSAVDLKYLDPAAQQWVQANASQYGLNFPMPYEPWHVEPAGARDGKPPLSFGLPPVDTSSAGILAPDTAQTDWQGLLANLGSEMVQSQPQVQSGLMPIQRQPYTPVKRDTITPYLEFFKAL